MGMSKQMNETNALLETILSTKQIIQEQYYDQDPDLIQRMESWVNAQSELIESCLKIIFF